MQGYKGLYEVIQGYIGLVGLCRAYGLRFMVGLWEFRRVKYVGISWGLERNMETTIYIY